MIKEKEVVKTALQRKSFTPYLICIFASIFLLFALYFLIRNRLRLQGVKVSNSFWFILGKGYFCVKSPDFSWESWLSPCAVFIEKTLKYPYFPVFSRVCQQFFCIFICFFQIYPYLCIWNHSLWDSHYKLFINWNDIHLVFVT